MHKIYFYDILKSEMGFIENGMKIGLAGSILAGTVIGEGVLAKDYLIPAIDKDNIARNAQTEIKDSKNELLLVDPANISRIRELQQRIRSEQETIDNNDQALRLPGIALGMAVVGTVGLFAASSAVEGVSMVSSRRRINRSQASSPTV